MSMWDDLTVDLRAKWIAFFAKNGIYKRSEVKDKYNLLLRINKSDADFVLRLKDPDRAYIRDWQNPDNIATHKMSWADDGVVYSQVLNKNGLLEDYSRPPYSIWAGYDNAIRNGDTIHMTPEEAEWFTTHYKNFYPGFNEYKKGGSIHIKPENRGKFTALKKRTGHSASWFKAHGTPALKKMATFALNAKHWKHLDGGYLDDIIWDNMGLWSHPGLVTGITGTKDGTDITMNGVADYLIGKDNLGNVKFMKPGMNYHFPGSSVVEYPVSHLSHKAQDGKKLIITPEQELQAKMRYSGYFNAMVNNGINPAYARDAAYYATLQSFAEAGWKPNKYNNYGGMKNSKGLILYPSEEAYFDAWVKNANNKWPDYYKSQSIQDWDEALNHTSLGLFDKDLFYKYLKKNPDTYIYAPAWENDSYLNKMQGVKNRMDGALGVYPDDVFMEYTYNQDPLNQRIENNQVAQTYQYGGLIKPFSYTDIPVVRYGNGGNLFLEAGLVFKRPQDDLTGRNILTNPILPPKLYYEQFTVPELKPKKPQPLLHLEGTYGNKYSELIPMSDDTYVNNPINKGLQLDWRTHTLGFAPFLAIGAGPAIGSTATWLASSKPALYNLGRMTLGSEIGGRSVDLSSRAFTGNTWGLNVGNVVEGITGWNPNNTMVGQFVTDATNPGYIGKEGLANIAGLFGNYKQLLSKEARDKLWNQGKDIMSKYYGSEEFKERALNAGFNEKEYGLLKKELNELLDRSVFSGDVSNVNGNTIVVTDKSVNGIPTPHIKTNPNLSESEYLDVILHEMAHGSSANYAFNNNERMNLVGQYYPMIKKMMLHDISILPKLNSKIATYIKIPKDRAVEDLMLSDPGLSKEQAEIEHEKLIKGIIDLIHPQEVRSRAVVDLLSKGNSRNTQELNRIFEPKSLEKYKKEFLSIPLFMSIFADLNNRNE